MQVTEIPFIKFLDIKEYDDKLYLDYRENILNHVKTIHASAQFTLAETKSGAYLQIIFPELKDKVVPLLRDATIKYKKPAERKIFAFANISEENIEKFEKQFARKARGSIEVDVVVKDINDIVTAEATFTWFITKIVSSKKI